MSGKQRIAKNQRSNNFLPTPTTNSDHVALWSLMGVFLASCGGGGGGGGGAPTGLLITGGTGTRMEHAVAATVTGGNIGFSDAQDASAVLDFLVYDRPVGGTAGFVEIDSAGGTFETGQEITTQYGTITFYNRVNTATEATITWRYEFRPETNVPQSGHETITVQVRDSGGGLAQNNIVITVTGMNDDVVITIPDDTVVGARGTAGAMLDADTVASDLTTGHRVIIAVTEQNITGLGTPTAWQSLTFEDEETADANMTITFSLGEALSVEVETAHNSASNFQTATIMRSDARIGEFHLYRDGDTVTFRFALDNSHADLNDADTAVIEILPALTVADDDGFSTTDSSSPQRETVNLTVRITDIATDTVPKVLSNSQLETVRTEDQGGRLARTINIRDGDTNLNALTFNIGIDGSNSGTVDGIIAESEFTQLSTGSTGYDTQYGDIRFPGIDNLLAATGNGSFSWNYHLDDNRDDPILAGDPRTSSGGATETFILRVSDGNTRDDVDLTVYIIGVDNDGIVGGQAGGEVFDGFA